MIAIGTKVRVTHPTGGVRHDDEFVVILRPADRIHHKGMNYVEFTGPIDPLRPWTIYGRVMGFVDESLTVVES